MVRVGYGVKLFTWMKRRHKFVLCVAVVFLVGYYLLSSTADMLEPDSHETHEPSLMNREGAALTSTYCGHIKLVTLGTSQTTVWASREIDVGFLVFFWSLWWGLYNHAESLLFCRSGNEISTISFGTLNCEATSSRNFGASSKLT